MGTDIHAYVEIFDENSNKWKVIPPPARDLVKWPIDNTRNSWSIPRWGPYDCMRSYSCADRNGEACIGYNCQYCAGHGVDMQWYQIRDYRCFWLLAGLRCNFKGMTPMDSPRGEPPKMSNELSRLASWDHSISWFGLDELLVFNWEVFCPADQGWVPLCVYDPKSYYGSEKPDVYSKWRNTRQDYPAHAYEGSQEHHPHAVQKGTLLDTNQADKILDSSKFKSMSVKDKKEKYLTTYVKVSWEERMNKKFTSLYSFINEILVPATVPGCVDLLSALTDSRLEGCTDKRSSLINKVREETENVRFVFGFDS